MEVINHGPTLVAPGPGNVRSDDWAIRGCCDAAGSGRQGRSDEPITAVHSTKDSGLGFRGLPEIGVQLNEYL